MYTSACLGNAGNGQLLSWEDHPHCVLAKRWGKRWKYVLLGTVCYLSDV